MREFSGLLVTLHQPAAPRLGHLIARAGVVSKLGDLATLNWSPDDKTLWRLSQLEPLSEELEQPSLAVRVK